MGIIKKLDQHITNLIAAGEVIEKVSSVVKELVENSIDALSTNINISLTDGGLKEIIVSDNGKGMDPVDAKMAILPHATSKISDANDLFNIRTLGFRGEALPSIIAVSQFKMKTCAEGSKGTMLVLKDGVLISEAFISHPIGTEISVRNLFYNTPPRLQTLKSESVELSGVTDYVSRIALSNPTIAFKLTNNGKLIFQTYGTGNKLEAISNIYGSDIAKDMIPIHNSIGNFRLSGYISNISSTRSNKNYINVIVNGRMIKNPSLVNAICEGYKTLLTIGRYPIAVVEILVDPTLVDVNAHPSKLEVRFSEEQTLIDMIIQTIQVALSRTDLTVSLDKHSYEDEELEFDEIIDEEKLEISKNILNEEEVNNSFTDFDFDLDDFKTKDIVNEEIVYEKPIVKEEIKKEEIIKESFSQQQYSFTNEDIEKDLEKNTKKLPKLFYIGQLFGTYLLAQNEGEFFVIDQHAANERINYEKILKELKNDNNINYELLIPIKLNFTASEVVLLEEKMEAINKLGIELEDFGGGTYTVRKVPVWLFRGREKEFIEEIISQILIDKKQEKYQFLDSLAKSLACKKSVKANDYLSKLEIDYLLEDLEKCEKPFTCPHGRPTIVKFSKYEIEKWFKRV